MLDVDEEVEALQVALGRGVFTGEAEILPEGAADSEEDRLVAAVKEFVDREVAPEGLTELVVAAQARDHVRFGFQKLVGEAVGGNADARHPARVGFLLEDVDAVAAAKQMVGAVDPRGTRAHDRDRGGNGRDRTLFLREEVFDCGARFVGRVALQFLDPDRRVDLVAKTRLFAGTNADAPAGADQRIVAKQNGRREFGMTVADVVDVARNVDVRGTGLDAGSGRHGVEVARRLGHRGGPAQHFGEVFERAPERLGSGLSDPAEARLAHLHEKRADAVPVDRFAFAAGGLLKRLVDEDRPHAAGRAASAGEALGARVVLTQKFRERHAQVEHQKALRTREARHGVSLIEGEKRLEGELALRAVGGAATIVVDLPLPNAVDEFVHKGLPWRSDGSAVPAVR